MNRHSIGVPLTAMICIAVICLFGIYVVYAKQGDPIWYGLVFTGSMSLITLAWLTYGHMRQHTLIEMQIEKLRNDTNQFLTWKYVSDVEKYIKIREIFDHQMVIYLNCVLLSHCRNPISSTHEFLNVENVDTIINYMVLSNDSRPLTLYDNFTKLVKSLSSYNQIACDILPYEGIELTKQLLEQRGLSKT